jgi:uncharacterized protein
MPRYHMNRADLAITDPEDLRTILRRGKYTVIALCRENEPYVVSLSYGYDPAKNALYFHCALKGLKLDFIEQNPRACATVINDMGYITGDCDHAFRSVVLWGEMSLVRELDEKKHAVEVLLNSLEPDPEVIKKRSPISDPSYDKVGILRFDIREMTGKRRP